MKPRCQVAFNEVDMKSLAILIVVPFFILMALIVCFQFARIIISELKASVIEAWHSPEMQSPS